jgi:hypothetical protein
MVSLLIACSVAGLLHPDLYSSATPNWLAQTVGQDAIDLFLIAPLLTVSALYAYYGNRLARMIWGGTVTYMVYTFLIYCFSVKFNSFFGAYCAILGLSVFSVVSFLKRAGHEVVHISDSRFIKTSAVYFIAVPVAFSVLWLMEIVPASAAGTIPSSVAEAGLPTNPVHVIDLSMFLPAVFMLGLQVWKRRTWAFYLVPVVLIFFILMDITVACLAAIMMQQGQPSQPLVVVGMSALALFSFSLLIWFLNVSEEDLSHGE